MPDYFIFRHSHVDYIPPAAITAHNALTPLGHQLAERLAARCAEWDLQYLFASPLRRARETADAISARFPDLPRRAMPEFAEVTIDDMAGYPGGPVSEDLSQWSNEHFAYANERMWARVLAGWDEVQRIVAEQKLERVAIVSHGGPINALIRHFMGDGVARLRDCWFELDWTATCCLRDGPRGHWVRWVNDARHIDDLRPLLAGK